MRTNGDASRAVHFPHGRPVPGDGAARRPAPGRPLASATLDGALDIIGARFPRIADRIRMFWDSPGDIDDYLSSLMLMEGNAQQGFPLEVMGAVLQVWECHRAPQDRASTAAFAWADEISLHKALRHDGPRR